MTDSQKINTRLREICHDLKTPMTVIQGALKVMREELLPEDQRELVAAARRSLEKINRLIDELHALTRD